MANITTDNAAHQVPAGGVSSRQFHGVDTRTLMYTHTHVRTIRYVCIIVANHKKRQRESGMKKELTSNGLDCFSCLFKQYIV